MAVRGTKRFSICRFGIRINGNLCAVQQRRENTANVMRKYKFFSEDWGKLSKNFDETELLALKKI